MPKNALVVRGARQHNLKNITLEIPRERLVVITGVSGSGKSSLAFDTIYAEGQRRYVESLSSYARQFLGQMDKPDVDAIEGLSPAISIDQKTTSHNPRSTVGTVTEVYDYLRLLYARVGHPHCPRCGRPVSQQTVEQMMDRIAELPADSRLEVWAPLVRGKKGTHDKVLDDVRRQGFTRIRVDGTLHRLDEVPPLEKNKKHTLVLVVDRVTLSPSSRARLAESIEHALEASGGIVEISVNGEGEPLVFGRDLACVACGITLEELTPRLFSFNAPYGACPACTGLGYRLEVDPALVVPDDRRSVAGGAVVPFFRSTSRFYPDLLEAVCALAGIPVDAAWRDLPPEAHQIILHGYPHDVPFEFETAFGRHRRQFVRYQGAIPILERRHKESDSEAQRAEAETYMREVACPVCQGQRLKPEVLAVTVGGRSIAALTALSIDRARQALDAAAWTPRELTIARAILKELHERLGFLVDVGLGYLTLDRTAGSLSGGEAQRIRLATQIGSSLVGVLYILDEPSIGLHQRDNQKLIATLKRLRDLGNSVLVVEHDEETMREADWLVDIGPGPGVYGGHVVAAGTPAAVMANPASLTGQYLSGARAIPTPASRRAPTPRALKVVGATAHNLKDITVEIPLGLMVAVTGVSGSGKSTLVNDIIRKRLEQELNGARTRRPGTHRGMEGQQHLDKVIAIDQSPIGRTPRSNPATYTGAFDLIRELFAGTPEASVRGYRPGRFSFNVRGGRCEACRGDGILKIEMHFLPDVYVPCEVCKGQRYNRETLAVHYRGKSIAEVLDMTVDEGRQFFHAVPRLARKLDTLADVGLGYIRLGQPATTLSGGEAQRVKLATELSRRSDGRTLYILDEPTTGLHSQDIEHLLGVLARLVAQGDTVLVIEHNLDVIQTADWIIDLGPEGGDAGGQVLASGPPEDVMEVEASYTGQFLRRHAQREAVGRYELR